MLPRRLGARFALEALFLVLLAVGAGLADLRPLFIVLVMALAWLLVALAELTAERVDRSPLSYLLPARPEEEPERVFGPRPEERTVVAPLESLEAQAAAEQPEPEPEPDPDPEPVAAAEPEPERDPEPLRESLPGPLHEPVPGPPPATVVAEGSLEPSSGSRLRSLLRRKGPEPGEDPVEQPRHVKLLPRRAAPEPSKAAQEVAELFGPDEGKGAGETQRPKETGT